MTPEEKAAAEAKAAAEKAAADKAAAEKELNDKIAAGAKPEEITALVKAVTEAALTLQAKELDVKLTTAIQTEKEKLYDTIKKEKDKAADLEKQLQVIADEKKAAEDKKKEEDKEKLDALGRVKLLEDELSNVKTNVAEVMKLQEMEFKKELSKRDCEVLKARIIADAGGKIIADLISGDTEEEIKRTAEVAKARYEEIVNTAKKEILGDKFKEGKIPEGGRDDKTKEEEEKDANLSARRDWERVMNMKPEELKKYKEEFEAKFFGSGSKE